MRRKLWLLNIAMLAAAGVAGWRLREFMRETEQRRRAVETQKIAPAPAPPVTPPAAPPVVQAASYIEIAQKPLFWKDRSSQVIIDAPEPKKAKPLPPLPVLYGMMNFGDGPILMMAERGATKHRGIKVGEQIGEYKVAALEPEVVVLTWEDQTLRKRKEELGPSRDTPPPQAAGTPSGQVGPANTGGPAAPPPPAAPAKSEPGVELTPTIKACLAGDTSPAGAMVDGYKKITTPTPFGVQCRWEKQ